MGGLILIVVTYVSIPAASTAVGGLVGAFKPPGPRVRSAIQHFAAGVVFSVVAVELLPHIVREHKPSPVLIGFPLGVIVMLGLRALTRDVEHSAKSEESLRPVQKWPIALIAAIAIDILIDGMILGVGFSAGDREGRLLTFALTVELLSLGLAGSVTLVNAGIAPIRAAMSITGLALTIVLGAILGGTVLTGAFEGALEIALSFGLAALLFLVTEELLVEAHEVQETPLSTATFFAGFLLFLMLGMLD